MPSVHSHGWKDHKFVVFVMMNMMNTMNQALAGQVGQVGQAGQNPISECFSPRRGERRKNTTPISSTVSGVSDSSPRGLVEIHWRGNLSWEHLQQVAINL